MDIALEQQLEEGLSELGLSLDEATQARLLSLVALLVKWNRVYNLTSVRKPADMISRHILDSLAVLPFVQGPRVLDIGTGAGLPGIPLALVRPDWQWVLLDSSSKKIRFVRQVVTELELDNVEIVQTRIEEYRQKHAFSTVISRAFSSLNEFYKIAKPLLGDDGCILAMKGVYPIAEIESLEQKDRVETVHSIKVPQLDAERHVVIMN